jgi:cytochrome c553
MNTLKKTLMMVLFLFCLFAATSAAAADKAAGEQKASLCAGCHGATGQSSNTQFPNLAAQQSTYIVSQLKAFKAKTRNNPMMEHIASMLSEEDMDNVAAYFSSQSRAKAGGDAALAKTGQAKATMCLGCHGESAAGNGQFPMLAGQHPDYVIKQLSHFKDGSRKNGQMQGIAATLSDDDMKALAAYFGSL